MKIINAVKEHDQDKTHERDGVVTLLSADATATEIAEFCRILNED